jgi:hypothetical protein
MQLMDDEKYIISEISMFFDSMNFMINNDPEIPRFKFKANILFALLESNKTMKNYTLIFNRIKTKKDKLIIGFQGKVSKQLYEIPTIDIFENSMYDMVFEYQSVPIEFSSKEWARKINLAKILNVKFLGITLRGNILQLYSHYENDEENQENNGLNIYYEGSNPDETGEARNQIYQTELLHMISSNPISSRMHINLDEGCPLEICYENKAVHLTLLSYVIPRDPNPSDSSPSGEIEDPHPLE